MPRNARPAVTIRHVAAEAGVSLQTVSRVMNDEPNVRAVVQERVRAAVEKLGYVPSLAARRLAGARSHLIVAFNDRDRTIEGWRLRQGTDWLDQMLYGGVLTCAEHRYRFVFELLDTRDTHVEAAVTSILSQMRPDGVILTPPHSDNPALLALLAERGVRFARIGAAIEGPGYAIRMDEAAAAEAATNHLLDLGHVRIGFIGGDPAYRLSEARLEGYKRAVAARGLPIDEALTQAGDFGFESGERAAKALLALDEPATAVIASSDQMALAVLHVAHAAGLAIPARLSVVSFDDSPVIKFSVPPMTAITQPVAPMAACAAELLIRASGGEQVEPGPHILPFELAVRGSTAPRGR